MDALALIGAARAAIGAAVAGVGLVFVLGGALGLLRFPDVYTRTHAVLSSDGPGAALVATGLAIVAWDFELSSRLALIAVLAAALGPLNAHIVANAAHAGGLAPLSGPYIAPRPGRAGRGAP